MSDEFKQKLAKENLTIADIFEAMESLPANRRAIIDKDGIRIVSKSESERILAEKLLQAAKEASKGVQ
jgi:hypothetical protein